MQFLSLPNSAIERADVLILPVPFEQTVTYRQGTGQGPAAILAASNQLEFYEEDVGWCPMAYLKLAVLPPADVACGSEEGFHNRLFKTVDALPTNNLFVGLGGEHSITPEMVFARMPEGGTVVQIDAHADLRSTYHGSIYNHACPMYRLWQRNYALVQIGIRSLHADEAKLLAAEQTITTYFDRTLQHADVWHGLLQTLETLSGPVWLTIDMDGFDPALIPSVGTPQPGGISWYQGMAILQTLINNRNVDLRGIDILELVPEENCVSDMVAAKLLQKCISYWGKAKGFDKRQAKGSQIGVEDE
ncbi:MAG: agmatinase [Candidatus Thiodiazotropha sp. (ex Codakia rugifera)]|nr:agmatinase [Candidatus Thiodiazotropha sp. (ex Codakia rugifera)]